MWTQVFMHRHVLASKSLQETAVLKAYVVPVHPSTRDISVGYFSPLIAQLSAIVLVEAVSRRVCLKSDISRVA